MKYCIGFIFAGLLLVVPACKPKSSDITPLQRKQAENLVSEAEFALNLKDIRRAEGLYLEAAKLCPDTADYWISLGVCRRKLDDRAGAKSAYESALKASKAAQRLHPEDPRPLQEQVYVLGLLGRADDAREVAEKSLETFHDTPQERSFSTQAVGQMFADPNFKAASL